MATAGAAVFGGGEDGDEQLDGTGRNSSVEAAWSLGTWVLRYGFTTTTYLGSMYLCTLRTQLRGTSKWACGQQGRTLSAFLHPTFPLLLALALSCPRQFRPANQAIWASTSQWPSTGAATDWLLFAGSTANAIAGAGVGSVALLSPS